MKKYGLLSVLLLCLTACSAPRQAEKAASRNAIVWTNQLVEPLLVFDNSVISYRLKPKYRRRTVPFSAAEKTLPLKGDTYNYDLNSLDGRYYTVAERKDKNGYDYKLIVYNAGGDDDAEILVTQLISYKQGKPIDALLLELNFTFEIAYSSRYIVDNKSIRIDQYAINDLQCSEDGDIIGTKEVPDSTVWRLVYHIKDGQFMPASIRRIK